MISSMIKSNISLMISSLVTVPQWTFGYNGVDTYGLLNNIFTPSGNDFKIIIQGKKGSTSNSFSMFLGLSGMVTPFIGSITNGSWTATTTALATFRTAYYRAVITNTADIFFSRIGEG